MHHRKQQQSAFSLVELSIVLVILGLLVGGILGGQSLIRAAELRSVVTEYQHYKTAINSFRLKYHALPGDQRNAFAFWGSRAGCTDEPADWYTTGCNGNEDGQINEQQESLRAWQFLALGGFVAGTFDGFATSEADVSTPRTMPAARLGAGVWHLATLYQPHASQYSPSRTMATALRIAAPDGNRAPDAPVMSPEEAWSLDSKMDDGKPGSGIITAHNHSTAINPCVNDGENTAIIGTPPPAFSIANSTYYLVSGTTNCMLQFTAD